MKDLIFLDAAEQAGAEYLGGGLAQEPVRGRRVQQEAGPDPEGRSDEASYNDAVTRGRSPVASAS